VALQVQVVQAVPTQAQCLHAQAVHVLATTRSLAQAPAWAVLLVQVTTHSRLVIAVAQARQVLARIRAQCLLVLVAHSAAAFALLVLAVQVAVLAVRVAVLAVLVAQVVQVVRAAQAVQAALEVHAQLALAVHAQVAVAVLLAVAVPLLAVHHVQVPLEVAVTLPAHSVAVAVRIRRRRSQSALVVKSSTTWQHQLLVAFRFSSVLAQPFGCHVALR
jgi:hypothetical protein